MPKKKLGASPKKPLAKFAGKQILVVAEKRPAQIQQRKWEEKLGEALQRVAVKAEVRKWQASMLDGLTHVVCDLEWEEGFGNVMSSLTASRPVLIVTYGWLDDAMFGPGAECPEECRYPWLRRAEGDAKRRKVENFSDQEDKIGVLSKYACQRATTEEGNRNARISDYISMLLSWWEHGTLTDSEDAAYGKRLSVLGKIESLVKAWPVELNISNWRTQARKLKKQHHIAESSSSRHGGWLALLESLACEREVDRDDSVERWSADNKRRVVRQIRMLKCGLGRKGACQLYDDADIRSAEELVARCDELELADARRRALKFAPVGPSATRMDQAETQTIVSAIIAAADAADLDAEIVGSYRRGKIGGHDIDVLLTPRREPDFNVPPQSELSDIDRIAAYKSCWQHITERLHGVAEIKGIGHGKVRHSQHDDRLSVNRVVIASPTVPSAFRHIDLVLTPPSIRAHSLLGWSGSRNFQRSFREYVGHCHEKNWLDAGGCPIVGVRGWDLNPTTGNRVYPPVFGRKLDHQNHEHWHWSQSGLHIVVGASTSKNNPIVYVYEEDNAHLRTEEDIFSFFKLEYRPPHERCA